MSRLAQRFRDREVYQESFRLTQEVLEFTKRLPVEERYSLSEGEMQKLNAVGRARVPAIYSEARPRPLVTELNPDFSFLNI